MKKRRQSAPPGAPRSSPNLDQSPSLQEQKKKAKRRASTALSPREASSAIVEDDHQPEDRPETTRKQSSATSTSGIVASLFSSVLSDSEKIKIARAIFSDAALLLPRKSRFIAEWISGTLAKSVEHQHHQASPNSNHNQNTTNRSSSSRNGKEEDQQQHRPHESISYWDLFAQVLERIAQGGADSGVITDAPHLPTKIIISLTAGAMSSDDSQLIETLLRCMRLLFREYGSIFRPSTDQFIAATERLITPSAEPQPSMSFLCEFLRILLDHIQQQPNQRKVFASVVGKLLTPIMLLRYATLQSQQSNESASGDNEIRTKEFHAILEEIIARTLFHSSHMSEYPMAFSVTRNKDSQQTNTPSKTKESAGGYKGSSIVSYQKQLFETLHSILKSDDQSHHLAVFNLLPFLLDRFIQAFYSALAKQTTEFKRNACFCFFMELFEMVRLPEKVQSDAGDGDSILPAALSCVSQMLGALLSHDIIIAGRETDKLQVAFLTSTVDLLTSYVQTESETPRCLSEAFWCLSQLLQLSYSAVQPKLDTLLLALWRHWNPEQHLTDPARDFQLHLLGTYLKLRQIDLLLGVLFSAMRKHNNAESPAFALLLQHWPSVVIARLPVAQVSSLWELILKEFSAHHNTKKNQSSALQQLLLFLHATLSGLLLEGNVQSLETLSQQTLDGMLKPLLKLLRKKFFSEKVSDLFGASVLQLYHAVLHVAYKTRALLKADAQHDGVASMTFQPLSKKLTLEALADASRTANLTYPKTVFALSELIVSRIAALLRSTADEIVDEAKTLAAILFQHAFHSEANTPSIEEENTACWNGQLLTVTAENLSSIALPHLVSRHLSLLCQAIDPAQLHLLLRAVLSTVGSSLPHSISQTQVTRASVFTSIISSAAFYEIVPVRHLVGRVILELLRERFTDAGGAKHPLAKHLDELATSSMSDLTVNWLHRVDKLQITLQRAEDIRACIAPLRVAAAFPANYLSNIDAHRLALASLLLLQCTSSTSEVLFEALYRLLSALVRSHRLPVSRVLNSETLIALLQAQSALSESSVRHLVLLEENYLRDLLSHQSAETKQHLSSVWQFALNFNPSTSATTTPSKRKSKQQSPAGVSSFPLHRRLQFSNTVVRVLMDHLSKLNAELLPAAAELIQQYDHQILSPLLQTDNAPNTLSAALIEGFGFVLHFSSLHATWSRLREISWRPQTLEWIGQAMPLLARSLGTAESVQSLSTHDTLHMVRCFALIVQALPLFIPPATAAQSAAILALLHHLMAIWDGVAEVHSELVKIYTRFISESSHQRLHLALQLIKQDLALREGNWNVRAKVSIQCAKIIFLNARGWRAQIVNKQLHVLISKIVTAVSHIVASQHRDAAELLQLALQLLAQVAALERVFSLSNLVSLCLLAVSALPSEMIGKHPVLFMAAYHLLMGLLWYRMEELQRCMPAFFGATQALLSGLAQTSGDAPAKSYAENLARLFEHLAQHPQQFRRYSAYLLSDYIHLLQSGSLMTDAKAAMQKGAFAVLNVCTEFEHAQLYRVLDANGKMLFKALHTEYLREYKFTGKV